MKGTPAGPIVGTPMEGWKGIVLQEGLALLKVGWVLRENPQSRWVPTSRAA